MTAAESALRTIRGDLGQVFAPGVDLVEGDPSKAMSLLSDAYRAVDAARTANVPPATLDPLRAAGRRRARPALPRRAGRQRDGAVVRRGEDAVRHPVDDPRPGRDAVRPRQGVEHGLPDRPPDEEGDAGLPAEDQGGRRDRGDPEAARDGRPRPADHRRQEHGLAVARRRTRRATARSGRSRSRGRRAGATTSSRRARSCATPARASTTSTSSTRRSRTSSPTRRLATAAASR